MIDIAHSHHSFNDTAVPCSSLVVSEGYLHNLTRHRRSASTTFLLRAAAIGFLLHAAGQHLLDRVFDLAEKESLLHDVGAQAFLENW